MDVPENLLAGECHFKKSFRSCCALILHFKRVGTNAIECIKMHICSKMCGISALPSKTDFKPHTARFGFEGRLVWERFESEKVLVLFRVCSKMLNDPE